MTDHSYPGKSKDLLEIFLKWKFPLSTLKDLRETHASLYIELKERITFKLGGKVPIRANLNAPLDGETEVAQSFRAWFAMTHPGAYNNPDNVNLMVKDVTPAVVQAAVNMDKIVEDAVNKRMAAISQAAVGSSFNGIGNIVDAAIQARLMMQKPSDLNEISRLIDTKVQEKMTEETAKVVGAANVQFTDLKDKICNAAVDRLNDEKTVVDETTELLKQARLALETSVAKNAELELEKTKLNSDTEKKIKELEIAKKDAEDATKAAKEATAKAEGASKATVDAVSLREELSKLSLLVTQVQKGGPAPLVGVDHFNRTFERNYDTAPARKSNLASVNMGSENTDKKQTFVRKIFKSITSTCKQMLKPTDPEAKK